jgi:hypothetical protein
VRKWYFIFYSTARTKTRLKEAEMPPIAVSLEMTCQGGSFREKKECKKGPSLNVGTSPERISINHR